MTPIPDSSLKSSPISTWQNGDDAASPKSKTTWQEIVDHNTGLPFFFNEVRLPAVWMSVDMAQRTGERVWELPETQKNDDEQK